MRGGSVLKTSFHLVKELLFFLCLGGNLYLTYVLCLYFNPSFSEDIFPIASSTLSLFLLTFFSISILEGLFLFSISKKFSRKQRLATSKIITWREVSSEQKGQKTIQFYIKGQRKFGIERSALPLAKNLKLTTEKMFEHVALFGPTGSGKSSTYFIPILRTVDDASFVVTDPKGELINKTGDHLKKKGYIVLHLNLTNPGKIGYSLLKNCRTANDVRKLSESIMGNDQWGNISKPLLQTFLFQEWVQNKKNPSLKNVVSELLQAPKTPDELDLFFSGTTDENVRLSYLKFKASLGSDGLVSSIFNTVIERTQVFEYDNLKQIEEKQLFPNRALRERKIALFVSYPEEESEIYQPFLSSFYYQLFNQIKSEGDNGDVPVYFLLDEFANIGKISGLSKLLATIRSRKMGVMMGIQSVSQLESVYGAIDAKTIIENAKTKIGLAGMSGETSQFFSDLCGEEEYVSQSISYGSQNSNVSTSVSASTKKVMPPDEVRRLKTHEVVIIGDNLRPIKDFKNFYYYDRLSYFIYLYSPFSIDFTNCLITKYQKNKKRL